MYHYSIPYKRNPFFTGRTRVLAELDTFFASSLPTSLKIVALLGMPGIGKTEVALEYTHRSFGEYQAVVWLDAPSRHQLAEHISRALGMRFPWKTDDEREQIFAAFREWLWDYQPSFLLVLDHIRDVSLLSDLLDEGMGGHVLLTSAEQVTMDRWKSVTVQPFAEQESCLFLLRRIGLLTSKQSLKHASPSQRQAAAKIHAEFGGHPLALDQAGAYLEETGMDLANYLPLYQQDRRAFLGRRGSVQGTHPFSAYSVIAAMRQGYAYDAQELLFLYVRDLIDCSDPYPHLPPGQGSSSLRQRASDPTALFKMRAMLIHNFLLVPLHGRKWGMHPLVRTVMNEVLAYEKEQDQQNRARDEEYESLDEDGTFHLLVKAQQMKKNLVILQRDDPERMQLIGALAKTVLRLQRAVQPGTKHNQAKAQIEKRYSDLAYGNNAPLFTASEEDLRQYARELVALMQHRY